MIHFPGNICFYKVQDFEFRTGDCAMSVKHSLIVLLLLTLRM